MRTGTVLGVLTISTVLLACIPAVREELHWRCLGNRVEDYACYLEFWPNGRYSSEALSRQDDRTWEQVTNASAPEVYESYLKTFRSGRHAEQAIQRLEQLHWQEAVSSKSAAAFDAYMRLHPRGARVEEAQTRSAALRTKHAKVAIDPIPRVKGQVELNSLNQATWTWSMRICFRETNGVAITLSKRKTEIACKDGTWFANWGYYSGASSPPEESKYDTLADEIDIPANDCSYFYETITRQDSRFCDGVLHVSFSGLDANGHALSVGTSVTLE